MDLYFLIYGRFIERAVNAFRFSYFGVKDQTQIHTHMCYSLRISR